MAGPQRRVGIRVLDECTPTPRDRAVVTQSPHPSIAIGRYGAQKAERSPRVVSITSPSDMSTSPAHIADQLEMARQRLELLMAGADQAGDGSAWLALNDAAYCAQRALVALGTIGVDHVKS
jgi:hypothetical protein